MCPFLSTYRMSIPPDGVQIVSGNGFDDGYMSTEEAQNKTPRTEYTLQEFVHDEIYLIIRFEAIDPILYHKNISC